MRYRALTAVVALLGVCAVLPFSRAMLAADTPKMPLRSASIVIENRVFSLPGPESHPVILAIWSDGNGVVSLDELNGGPPYLAFRVAPEKVKAVLSGLHDDGLFQDGVREINHSGYGSNRTTITCVHEKETLTWSSWHELHSRPGKKIVTSDGVCHVRPEVNWLSDMSESSPRYLAFLVKWHELRCKLAVLSRNATPTNGQFASRDGAIVWDGDWSK